MRFLKQPAFCTLFILFICITIQPFLYNTINLLHTINLTFLFSAVFLFFGFFLAMIAMGTFDSGQFLVHRILKPHSSERDNLKTHKKWSEKVGKSYLYPLNVGFTLFVLCMACLAMYYLF